MEIRVAREGVNISTVHITITRSIITQKNFFLTFLTSRKSCSSINARSNDVRTCHCTWQTERPNSCDSSSRLEFQTVKSMYFSVERVANTSITREIRGVIWLVIRSYARRIYFVKYAPCTKRNFSRAAAAKPCSCTAARLKWCNFAIYTTALSLMWTTP